MMFDIRGNVLRRIPKKIGTVFFIGTTLSDVVPFRRKRGILVTARRGNDPTIHRAFLRRWDRRTRR